MILEFKNIKNCGVFRDFKSQGLEPFAQYNLIYGWNGSGKSTLSLVFESIEKKQNIADAVHSGATFAVDQSSGSTISSSNLTDHNLIVRTFNENFIRENIDWQSHTKSLLVIAKEKIAERKQLESEEAALIIDKNNLLSLKGSKETQEEAISKFFSQSAKNIKTNLQVIDTKDSRFLNYDKRSFEKCVTENFTKDDVFADNMLSDSQLNENTIAARPDKKAEINFALEEASLEKLTSVRDQILRLITKSVVNQIIERLANNAKLQSWVEEGLNLHSKGDDTKCEFCGNLISDERKANLDNHFNKEYGQFKNEISSFYDDLQNYRVVINFLPNHEQLYPELRERYCEAKAELDAAILVLNSLINDWQQSLQRKIDNPFESDIPVAELNESVVTEVNKAVRSIKDIVSKHNFKTQDFDKATQDAKELIEKHYAASAITDFDYFNKLQACEEARCQIGILDEAITRRKQEIERLKNALVNEELGAEQLNKALHSFLGRDDLRLVFNKKKLGYEIWRRDSNKHSESLSEGEKTAIAFIFFVLKLEENNNSLKHTIIAIDDPVSSFDSNHLFHSYAFLRSRCAEAYQIFVLTHNFTFFRRICDWFSGRNTNRENKNKPPASKFYVLEANGSSIRSSQLKNAPDDLIKFHSEYHYLFSRLHAYSRLQTISVSDSLMVANLGRRVLESFLAFKFPKYRSNFADLLGKAQSQCKSSSIEQIEMIKRFTDRFSHNNAFEIDSESFAINVGECPKVIAAIFQLMSELDKIHFDEMSSVVTTEPELHYELKAAV